MPRSKFPVAILGVAAALLLSFTQSVSAHVYPFASGVDSNTGNCFEWSTTSGSVGLVRRSWNGACNNHYYMPLYWRNFGGDSQQRQITITGRRVTSSFELTCSVFVYDAQGNLLDQDGAFFTQWGSNYTTITLSVDHVRARGTSVIACSMTEGDTYLLNANWAP